MKQARKFVYLFLIIMLIVIPIRAFTSQAKTVDLLAGKKMVDVGDVTVWNDEYNIYITYTTNEDWCLTATHLQPIDDLTAITGTKKGNPVPGQFFYKERHLCVDEYTYTVPMTPNWKNIKPQIVIAAQADVRGKNGGGKQGAWAGDREVPGKNWALYFDYKIQ